MARCVTCGAELHPERALKYDYCLAGECQEKNFKGLTMVAVGVNKAAEQYLILDERTASQARTRARSQAAPSARQAWTRSQERLALLYNEQGLRPAEIADKLGLSSHLVTQIVLAAKNRGKS